MSLRATTRTCQTVVSEVSAIAESYNPISFFAQQSGLNGLFFGALLFRLINALFLATYYNPDEYWQNQEIAYDMVFGNGAQTWEWREHARIRGFAQPLLTALVYKVLSLLGLDTQWLIVRLEAQIMMFSFSQNSSPMLLGSTSLLSMYSYFHVTLLLFVFSL